MGLGLSVDGRKQERRFGSPAEPDAWQGTYRKAWFLAHRLREAMTDRDPEPLGGKGKTVEGDEPSSASPIRCSSTVGDGNASAAPRPSGRSCPWWSAWRAVRQGRGYDEAPTKRRVFGKHMSCWMRAAHGRSAVLQAGRRGFAEHEAVYHADGE